MASVGGGRGDGAAPLLAVAAIAAAIVLGLLGTVALAWAEWYRFTFHIEDGTLRVEHGLIIRKSTRLTPERIQSIDMRANLLFRVLGLVTVNVHTAGRGSAPEVSIPALTEEDARGFTAALRVRESMRSLATGGDGSIEATPRTSGPVWRLSTRETLLVGATSSAGMLAFAALMPIVGGFAPVLFADTPLAAVTPFGSPMFFLFAGGMLAVMLLIGWVVGSVSTALAYWEFATERAGDEVRVERGLLQRESRSVPLDRIQAVRLIESPLRQALGRVTVGVDAAGIAAASEGQSSGPTILHPLIVRADAVRFADLMAPGHSAAPLRGLPSAARRRYVLASAVGPTVLAAVLTALSPWGALSLVLPVAAAAWGALAYADAGWSVHGGVLALRYRNVARTSVLIRRQRIQSVSVSQNPLQRIAGLGTLAVRIPSSPAPATFTIRHIGFADARHVLEWVSDGVEP